MKILISSRSFGGCDKSAIEYLRGLGYEVALNPEQKKLTEEEIIALIDDDVYGIIAGTEPITRKVIEAAKNLKVISRYGAGMDNVDLTAAEEKGVVVAYTPDAPSKAVAELALSLILNLLRGVSKGDRMIREGKWAPHLGGLLTGKTVGVVGLGRIGRALVNLLQPFKPRVLARETDPDPAFTSTHGIELVELKQLLGESDIVSLHLPLTPQTRHIIGEDELKQMKKEAVIINTARGELIDEKALYAALKEGVIAGAALDVFEEEPYTGDLKELNNIILTPHIGSCTKETRTKMEKEAVENIIKVLKEADTK